MLTLIVNGEVYSPAPLGAIDVLVVGDKIAKSGQVDRVGVEAIGVEVKSSMLPLLVVRKDSLEIVEVIARGRRLVAHGRVVVEEPFLKQSARTIALQGQKHKSDE